MSLSEQPNQSKQTKEETDHGPDCSFYAAEKSISSARSKSGEGQGKWSGDARVFRAPSEPVELIQTEDAYYKLDGLLLIIERTGRNRSDGKITLQALGVVSFDDEAGTYRMRAYNDGRYLETELKLTESGKGISWGFTLGDVKTSSVLRINEKASGQRLRISPWVRKSPGNS